MGTRFAITGFHPSETEAKKAADAAFAEAEKINEVASDYIADSELLSLSKQPVGTPTVISPLLFRLLLEARDFAEKTGGLFDPTIGPLTRLWRETRRRKVLPIPEILAAARAATGWENLILDPEKSSATFTKPDMRLDLGGIAKGQAADAMLAVMVNYGISRSSITAGGDVRLGGPPPGEDGWKVGVRTFDKNQDSSQLRLANCAVSTGGDLQQFVEIEGVRYSHIIDPATGLGMIRSTAATVIAPTATLTDVLDTACCIAKPEDARGLAMRLGATDVHLGYR